MKLPYPTFVAALAMTVCGSVAAQDPRPSTPAAAASPGMKSMPPAERNAQWESEKQRLEQMLGVGKEKAAYRADLERAGYWITSINADTPTRLEYEIVKGANSYEVQFAFRDNRATKVDVTTNVWKAASTKDALAGRTTTYRYPSGVARDADRISDAARNRSWMDEKGRIEAQLGVGRDRGYYKSALERMGFKVTSVNENDPRNLEYEVVRGDTTYEVQVSFDAASGKSTRVGVSPNMWEAETTERVKGDKK